MQQRRRYEVGTTLGEGAFGTVYRAMLITGEGFRKEVAVKILKEHASHDDEAVQRFRDEARMLGLIRHRAIVAVDGLEQLGGQWTVVMEFVEGVSLGVVVTQGPMPVGLALEVVAEVAGALDAAYHRKGPSGQILQVLHRDVKPENILISVDGDVKVLDFGIARATFDDREARTQVAGFGSRPYMSPERMLHEDMPAGDVYALGALLYELLCGERFGTTKVYPEAHQELIDFRMELLTSLVTDQDVIDLVCRMLAFDAGRRPTAREVETVGLSLRMRYPSPPLRVWARETIPDLRAQRMIPQGAHVGQVFSFGEVQRSRSERRDRRPIEPVEPQEELEEEMSHWVLVGLSATLVLAIVAMTVGLVVLGGVGGMAWWFSSEEPPPPPTPVEDGLSPPG